MWLVLVLVCIAQPLIGLKEWHTVIDHMFYVLYPLFSPSWDLIAAFYYYLDYGGSHLWRSSAGLAPAYCHGIASTIHSSRSPEGIVRIYVEGPKYI